jgi:hypothetical protein
MSQFRFVPLRNMDWNDFLSWTQQCAPECFTFLKSVLGSLSSIFNNELPYAQIESQGEYRDVVKLIWYKEDLTFVVKLKNSLISSGRVSLEWEIFNKKDVKLATGHEENSMWLPYALVHDFTYFWFKADEGRVMLLQLSLAIFIVFFILSGLIFFT